MREIMRLVLFAVIIFGISALSVVLGDPGIAASIQQRLGLTNTGVQVAQAPATPDSRTQVTPADETQTAADLAAPAGAGTGDAGGSSRTAATAQGAATNPQGGGTNVQGASATQVSGPSRLAEGDLAVRIARPHPGLWLGLEGFPSTTTIRFPLPQQLNIVQGQLQLDLGSQLIQQGDGLLRVLVNDTERDAVVLERGDTTLQLTYDLLPSDLAAGEVLVTLDANGTTNYGQICPTNAANLGAAVSVLETSGLMLSLEAPPTGAESRIALLPTPLILAAPDAPVLDAWATQWLNRQGVEARSSQASNAQSVLVVEQATEPVTVSNDGQVTLAGTDGLATAARIRGGTLPDSYAADWPLPIAALTADLATHTFRGSSRWPLSYKLADLPEGKAPGSLHLELRTSQLTEGNDWSVRVLLNGNIVYTANQPGSSETISLDIPLPSDIQKLDNQLSVILVDNSPNQGICRAGREAVAQLLPETRLEAAANPDGAEQTLVAALAGAQGVLLSGPTSASESTVLRASALLGEILPLDAPVHLTGTQPAQIRMVTEEQETTPAVGDGGTGSQAYVVAPNADEGPGAVTVTPMKDWPAGQQPEPGSLIVSW